MALHDLIGNARPVLCFGELLLRLTAPGRELLLQTPSLDVHVGGAEANVAVGLSKLGHKTTMVSRVPDNALGEAAIGYLRRYGVDVRHVVKAEGRMGLYFLAPGAGLRASEVVYDREASSFALCGREDFDWDHLLHGAGLLHMSGISPALGPRSADAALAAAEAAGRLSVPLSFDGNFRQQLWSRWDSKPREILARIVAHARILFGNHRDISLLLSRDFGGEGPERRRDAAQAAFDDFPRLELIASTARRVDNADQHAISARIDTRQSDVQTEEVKVAGIVDRIGAGDAFAAGILHGLASRQTLEQAARTGLALALLKHGLPGDASLIGPAELDSYLAGELDVRR